MFSGLLSNEGSKKRPLDVRKQAVKGTSQHNHDDNTKYPNLRHMRLEKPTKQRLQQGSTINGGSSNPTVQQRAVSHSRASFFKSQIDFGRDDSESETEIAGTPKRLKINEDELMDGNRQIRDKGAFYLAQPMNIEMIHAADIPALDKSTKYAPAIPELPEDFIIELEYPSMLPKERYLIFRPMTGICNLCYLGTH